MPFVPPPLPQPCSRVRRPRMSKNIVNHIKVSPLRPHVLASDRFLAWLTPFGNKKLAELANTFPPHLLARRRIIISKSVNDETLANYAAGLIRFTAFCDDLDIPECDRMPASSSLLSLFVTTRGTGSVGGPTIRTWLLGLELWHTINDAPWNGGKLLTRPLKASVKLAPESSHLKKREAVTIDHIRALRSHLDLSDSFDAAVWAAATTAFFGVRRLGEIMIKSPGVFDPKFHVSRSTPISRGVTVNNRRYSKFHIPSSKTKGLRGEDVNISDSGDENSAYSALENHLLVNSNVPGAAPLFAWETPTGWAPLTKTWFLARCNEIWLKAGSYNVVFCSLIDVWQAFNHAKGMLFVSAGQPTCYCWVSTLTLSW